MESVFELMERDDFEEIAYGYDKPTGLKAIVAIHDTTLGPAFGGTRMKSYSTEEEALKDCLKLSKAMTCKNAAAGINFGGGKAVIIGDAKIQKTEALLRAYGRFVEGLGGRFIAGVDVGTDENDMIILQQETKHVTALPLFYGGAGSTSGATAYGVYHAIRKAAQFVFGDSSLTGKKVAIQGVGNIGRRLLEYLIKEGATIYVADIERDSLDKVKRKFDVKVVDPEQIYDLDVDIFSPCAMGGILNDHTIPRLKCKLIAGSANNQLSDTSKHIKMLKERKIAFAVDFILSAGGVINNSQQYNRCGYNQEAAYKQVEKIGDTIYSIFKAAEEQNITTVEAAYEFAQKRLDLAQNLKKWYLKEEKMIKV